MSSRIQFNPNGGQLTVKAVFSGDLVADYGISLKEENSNPKTKILEGDNLNPQDDSVVLPTPVSSNNGRRVVLDTLFRGNNPDVNQDYEIRLEVYQDGVFLGADVDQSDPSNKLTGKAQPSLLLVTLFI